MSNITVDVNVQALTNLHNRINEIIGNSVLSNLKQLLKQIETEHSIDGTKYIERLSVVIDSSRSKSKGKSDRGKSDLSSADKCKALTGNKVQCSRRHKPGIDFCGCHEHNQAYGRVFSESEARAKEYSLLEKNGDKCIVEDDIIYKLPDDFDESKPLHLSSLAQMGKLVNNIPVWSA